MGVRKAQISKLESSAHSATIETILKVFKALNADIHFNVTIEILKTGNWNLFKKQTNVQYFLGNMSIEE